MKDDATDIERDLRKRYVELPTLDPASEERLRRALTARAGSRSALRPRRSLMVAAAFFVLGIIASSAFGFGPINAIRALDPHDAASIRHIGRTIDKNNRRPLTNALPPSDFAPAGSSAILAHHEQIVDGIRWSFVTYRNAEGLTCGGVRWTGGQGLSCYPLTQMLRDSPARRQLRWPTAQLRSTPLGSDLDGGFAALSIHKLTLRLSDCSTANVPLDRAGVLLYIVNHQRLRDLIWPSQLRAYDAHGHLIATQPIRLHAPNASSPSPPPRTCPR